MMTMARPEPVGTPAAVHITGVPEPAIRRAIEREEIHPLARRRGGTSVRLFRWPELVFLRLWHAKASAVLAKPARASLYRALRARNTTWSHEPIALTEHLQVAIAPAAEAVESALRRIEAAKEWVVRVPEIRGGEPVVRGTRVPVYELAALHGQGASVEELTPHFPNAPQEAIEAAITWAQLNPRRGRPAMRGARWKRARPTMRRG